MRALVGVALEFCSYLSCIEAEIFLSTFDYAVSARDVPDSNIDWIPNIISYLVAGFSWIPDPDTGYRIPNTKNECGFISICSDHLKQLVGSSECY